MLPHTTRAGATSSALTLTLPLTLPLTLTRCDQLCRAFQRQIGCNAIHGDKEQRERERVLQEFKDGRYTPLPLRYTSYYLTTYARTAGTPLLLTSDYLATYWMCLELYLTPPYYSQGAHPCGHPLQLLHTLHPLNYDDSQGAHPRGHRRRRAWPGHQADHDGH